MSGEESVYSLSPTMPCDDDDDDDDDDEEEEQRRQIALSLTVTSQNQIHPNRQSLPFRDAMHRWLGCDVFVSRIWLTPFPARHDHVIGHLTPWQPIDFR